MSDGLLNASVISLQNSQNILSVIRLHIGHLLNIFFVSPEPFSSVPLQGLWRNKKAIRRWRRLSSRPMDSLRDGSAILKYILPRESFSVKSQNVNNFLLFLLAYISPKYILFHLRRRNQLLSPFFRR